MKHKLFIAVPTNTKIFSTLDYAVFLVSYAIVKLFAH